MNIRADKQTRKTHYPPQNSNHCQKRVKNFYIVLLLSALAVSGFIAYSACLWKKISRPVSVVKIEGKFHYLSKPQIEHQLLPLVTANLFSLKLSDIKETLLALPWVNTAEFHRQWPDQLFIKIYERIPQARWNDCWLIDQSGNLFMPDNIDEFNHLPSLHGIAGHEYETWKAFLFLEKTLKALSLMPTGFTVDDTDSWSFAITDVKINVGEYNQHTRIEAFALLYVRQLKKQWSNIATVDLRYANGIAVAWKNSAPPHKNRNMTNNLRTQKMPNTFPVIK